MGTNFNVYLLKSCTAEQQEHTFNLHSYSSTQDPVVFWLCFLIECVYVCPPMCACVHAHAHMCVCAGVRAYPPVCVCTFLGSVRELTGTEKTASVTEETDIDAEEVSQAAAAEESNLNRGVTDLDATAKKAELNHTESKVSHCPFAYVCFCSSGQQVIASDLLVISRKH